MPDALTLGAFVSTSIVLILVPGPNLVFIVTRSLSQGVRAGMISALGVESATLIFVLATALGVGEFLSRSQGLLAVVQVIGAAYLVHLAIGSLRSPPSLNLSGHPKRFDKKRIFTDGLIVNLLNPKVFIFIVAFLPQFVDGANKSSPAVQLVVLGGVFFAVALCLDMVYAVGSGALSARLLRAGTRIEWIRWPVATVYLALAAYALAGLA